MEYISEELLKLISQRLKLGELAKPNYRIEVDRFAFIPGRVEHLEFATEVIQPVKTVQKVWIEPSGLDEEGNPIYEGYTVTNPYSIVFPVAGKGLNDITSYFGQRWGRLHSGVDISAPVGTSVYTAWAGEVINVNASSLYDGYGIYIDIRHDNGIITRYAHLDSYIVEKGQKVNQGQKIGEVGNTGYVVLNGQLVIGSYEDADSPRAKGLGSHLHFEVRVSSPTGNSTPVDPLPYLKGEKKLYGSSTTTGNGVTGSGVIEGKPVVVRLNELFTKREWYKQKPYIADRNFTLWSEPISVFSHTLNFRKMYGAPSKDVTGFDIALTMVQGGVLKLSYKTNFTSNSGDELRIYDDDKLVARVVNFSGNLSKEELVDVPIDEGTKTIRIEVVWNSGKERKFIFEELQIVELDNIQKQSIKSPDKLNGHWETVERIEEKLFSKIEQVPVQVGQFVYMDTITLDNVISIEIDDQFEMESKELRITISNPDGFYSPDYNPYYFPETFRESPWSYYANNYHIGVLSENTPIRVFLGYGQSLVRVFTGLISKVDMSADGTLTIYCRDMYKKIIEKVITVDKQYPDNSISNGKPSSNTVTSVDKLSRSDQIIYWAKFHCDQFNLEHGSRLDYKFLLAIAKHETNFGTTGMGVPEKGDAVLGYDCPGNRLPRPQYRGINKQMYFGAKRYFEALASRGWIIDSKDDVAYFHDGGDKGNYAWSGDRTNWIESVWTIYQDIKNNPSQWEMSQNVSSNSKTGVRWLKSAIVQDLISHAGMYGWRVNPEDIYYPDAVIEETYLIQVNQKTGMVVKAVPDREGEFVVEPFSSVPTPLGWLNPFVEEEGKKFEAYTIKVNDAINEIIKDTNYRSYCDRYGTYRLEQINLNKPIVAEFTEYDNLLVLNKTIDYSRARSHVVIYDSNGKFESFIDTELLMELKGEIRTARVYVPWAKSIEEKKVVAERLFFDMKRLSRTLQVTVPGNPALDILDRVIVVDHTTTTRSIYIIKGIRTSFSKENGYIQVIDLMWSRDGGTVV